MVRGAGALAICGIKSKEVSARFRGMVKSRGYTFEKGTERGSGFCWRNQALVTLTVPDLCCYADFFIRFVGNLREAGKRMIGKVWCWQRERGVWLWSIQHTKCGTEVVA